MNQNNTFYFLRHGETIKDPSKPTIEWNLTQETITALEALAEQDTFSEITKIYTSNEDKAIKSAVPFTVKLNIKPIVHEGLEEVHRGDKFLSDEEFKRLKREKLEDRDSNLDGGESSNIALSRFIDAINLINNQNKNTSILVSSHGTILSLYFSHLKNDFSNIFNYWNSIPFCGIGIVAEGKVLKDFNN